MPKEHNPRSLNAEQLKALDEVQATLTRAFDEARAQLEAAGLGRERAEQGAFCFRCNCDQFDPHLPFGLDIGSEDHPFNPCMRLGCGHSFLDHYVY
jgi:hypothetical protein